MARIAPRIFRYGIGLFVLFWVVAGQMSILMWLYSVIEPQFGVIPQLNQSVVGLTLLLAVVGTLTVGYVKFGSLLSLLSSVASWIIPEDDTLVEGRILEGDFAWRLKYKKGDRVTVECRECPRCGAEVVEGYLSNEVVYGTDTAFDAPEELHTTAEEVWQDVTGKEKAEDKRETQALMCPECNVSAPGEKEVHEREDAAISCFRNHINKMKKPNPKRSPFESYAKLAREECVADPMPRDIWDAYVQSIDSDDALAVRRKVVESPDEPIRQNTMV